MAVPFPNSSKRINDLGVLWFSALDTCRSKDTQTSFASFHSYFLPFSFPLCPLNLSLYLHPLPFVPPSLSFPVFLFPPLLYFFPHTPYLVEVKHECRQRYRYCLSALYSGVDRIHQTQPGLFSWNEAAYLGQEHYQTILYGERERERRDALGRGKVGVGNALPRQFSIPA